MSSTEQTVLPILLRKKTGYEGKCNQILKNYDGPNQLVIDILIKNGWRLIGSGLFGLIFSNDRYECVIKIPRKNHCKLAYQDFMIQEKLFNVTNNKFAFARIPEPYLFNSEGESCQYNMERVYALDNTNNLLIQIYLGTPTYNYKFVTDNQIRGWYLGYKEVVEKFDENILHQMVDNMGRLLIRSIIIGQIYPTDLEWVIGKIDKEVNKPMSYLIDFNEATPIKWDKSQREIAVNIAKDLTSEPYWPLNDSKYPLGEVFWSAFEDEARIMQMEFENKEHEELRAAIPNADDFDIELFTAILMGQFDKMMRAKLKGGRKKKTKKKALKKRHQKKKRKKTRRKKSLNKR